MEGEGGKFIFKSWVGNFIFSFGFLIWRMGIFFFQDVIRCGKVKGFSFFFEEWSCQIRIYYVQYIGLLLLFLGFRIVVAWIGDIFLRWEIEVWRVFVYLCELEEGLVYVSCQRVCVKRSSLFFIEFVLARRFRVQVVCFQVLVFFIDFRGLQVILVTWILKSFWVVCRNTCFRQFFEFLF